MKYGFVLPPGDARTAAETAAEAEQAGWDAFFVWEPVWGIDAWVCLTAAAMRTERIRLGTMLTPLSRMRPWKLASETATLDNLSGGRVILSVGLGAIDSGFAAFGEVTDRRVRAELLDEGLAILTGLWAGQPFSLAGHALHDPADRLHAAATAGAAPAHPDLGRRCLAATEVDGSGFSLRRPAPPRRQAHPRARQKNAGRPALAIYSSAGPESGGRPSGAAARRWSSHASSASVRFCIRRLASDMRVASDADAASRLRRSTKTLTTPDPKIASSSSQKPRTPTIHRSAAKTTKTRTRNSV